MHRPKVGIHLVVRYLSPGDSAIDVIPKGRRLQFDNRFGWMVNEC